MASMNLRASRLFLLVVVAAVTLVTPSSASSRDVRSRVRCQPDHYYDHGTGHCEHCRDICQYAEIQRTVAACKEQCPDYWAALQCQDDQYYDDVVGQCSPCSELCSNPSLTGDTQECSQKCQAYLDQQKSDAKQVAASHHIHNALAADTDATEEEQKGDDSSHSPIHPGYIAAICAGVFVLIFVPAYMIVFKRCTRTYEKAPQEDVERQGTGGNKPVEETIRGSSDVSQCVTAACSAPVPQTGFSDLGGMDREH